MGASSPVLPLTHGVRILVAILVGAGAILLAEHFFQSHLQADWPTISQEEAAAARQGLQSQFSAYQEETRSVVARALAEFRARHRLDAPADSLFDELAASPGSITFEFYDRHKEGRAWSANRGPRIDTARLLGAPTSFVMQGPIYSYLVVSLPSVDGGSASGYLVGKRLFDVNFPINNRFISSTLFTSTFTSQLRVEPDFAFPATAASSGDSLMLTVPLTGIGGDVIGAAIMERPVLSSRSDAVRLLVRQALGVLGLLFVLCVGAGIMPHIVRGRGWALRGMLWGMFLWGARFLFLWGDLPKILLFGGYFDPIHFASPFGSGLAQSVGDVLLSCVALLLSVLLLVVPGVRALHQWALTKRTLAGPRRALVWILLPAGALFLCLSLRAFHATVRSAVFDSSLSYNDPSSLFPGPELAVMLASLFLLSFAVVAAMLGILLAAYYGARGTGIGSRPLRAWTLVAVALLGLSLLFGAFYHHWLMTQEARVCVLAGGILLAAWISLRLERRSSVALIAALCAAASIALVVPALDEDVHELDRNHVELMAHEMVRPADSWLSFVVNRALDDVAGAKAARTLREGDRDDIDKLSFTQWAGSILSREGNNCSVTFVDLEGSVVSDFHIGIAPQWFRLHHMDEMPRSTRYVDAEDRSEGGGIVKWYKGYAPVFSEDSVFLGGVWVELSGVNQRLLRGETEDILRNSSREDFASHHRKLYFFEYFDGGLVSSTDEEAPLRAGLPAGVSSQADSTDGVWVDQTINTREYEVYFLPDGTRGRAGSWVALGMQRLGFRWHVYSFLRYVSFYLVLLLGAVACFSLFHILHGRRARADFRTKLLAAFLIVSLIPVIILAYYNSMTATERGNAATKKDLSRQTALVASELERSLGVSTPALLTRVSDEQCEDLAGAMDIDFNVYRGPDLQASSRSEMFVAELFDHSLSAGAYRNIVLGNRNFYTEAQTIGSLPYIVGYRPLRAENGNVIGVVAVPTLYSRNDIETDLTRRNAFLYGSYAFALVLSVIVGSLFANQIASPVRRLKRATAALAEGKMHVDLRRSGTDELGDLEEAFAKMTEELDRSQRQMLKAEKELAWREMAKQVAHEIKNPLTPMKLSVQHLRQAYRDQVADFGEVLGRVTGTVLEQIEALSRIASEFSNFARMPERKTERVDVHAVIGEARNLYHLAGVSFVLELAAAGAVVLADREELRRVFINILGNSVQAMGQSGTIAISTFADQGWLTVRVRDNGPGIPEEIRERLFEPNFSTKTGGMGLGLTIVRTTVDGIGGTVTIGSVPGAGTTVVVTLPLVGA